MKIYSGKKEFHDYRAHSRAVRNSQEQRRRALLIQNLAASYFTVARVTVQLSHTDHTQFNKIYVADWANESHQCGDGGTRTLCWGPGASYLQVPHACIVSMCSGQEFTHNIKPEKERKLSPWIELNNPQQRQLCVSINFFQTTCLLKLIVKNV